MGKLYTQRTSTFAGSLRAANHGWDAIRSNDIAWTERSTTSLVHAISKTTNCVCLCVGCAVVDVILTVASDLLTTIPTPPCLPVRSLYITDPI